MLATVEKAAAIHIVGISSFFEPKTCESRFGLVGCCAYYHGHSITVTGEARKKLISFHFPKQQRKLEQNVANEFAMAFLQFVFDSVVRMNRSRVYIFLNSHVCTQKVHETAISPI